MAPEPTKTEEKAKAPQVAAAHKAAKAPHAKVQVSSTQDEGTADARKGAKFLGLVVVAYIVYLVLSGQMGTFIEALSNVDRAWIIGAAICYVFYFIFGVGAYAVAVWLDHDSPVGVRDLMSVEASGVFFGNLTPMMAGAVPAQIVRLTRTGLDAGEAMATQFTRFIVFQFAVVLFAAIMLLAKFQFFLETYGDIVFLNLVVFAVHFVELVVLFVVCLMPGFVKRIGNWGIAKLRKRGWLLGKLDEWNELINVQVDEFAAAFRSAAAHVPSMAVTLVITMLQLASLYMIPWFVLHAFGRDGDFWACLAAGSMVQMVASAIPLPGGTGGAESGFALFYGPMFGSALSAGFLVWRIVTFFAPTLLSAPLLGLRSNSRQSIYNRVNALIGRLTGKSSKFKGGGGSISYKPKAK